MKRAIVYARVSTERQADLGLSIDSQIDACKAKAEEMGAVVLHVYRDDGISGTTDARPGFLAAINRCAAADINFMVCWSSSRFARDQHDAITYKRELVSYGTRLVYAHSSIDLESMEGWMLDSIQQVMDEGYSRQVSADTKRSMIKAARDGYFMGGREPFGYEAVAAADGRRRRLVPNEAEAAILRMIFSQAREGLGAYLIALQLNGHGVTMRGRRWNKNSVLHMLKSEVYMGRVIYNRFDRKHAAKRPEDKWIRVQAHPPLVTDQEFADVQAALDGRTPATGRTPGNTNHVFAGLMRCGACGSSLQMTNGTGRGGKLYHYYACRGHNQGQACTFKPIPADTFDQWMLDELLDKVLQRDVIQSVLDQLDDAATRWVKDRAARRTSLVLELRRAEQRRGKLFEIMETSGRKTPDLNPTMQRVNELTAQIGQIDKALTALEDEPEPLVGAARVSADEAAELMRQTLKGCRDVTTVRAFVATVVDELVIQATEVQVNYKPECLVQMDGNSVRSKHRWLPVPSTLRTVTVPIDWRAWRGRRAA